MYDIIKRKSIGYVSQIPLVPEDTCDLDSHVDAMCPGYNYKTESTIGITVRV